jgi:hypothetical protein
VHASDAARTAVTDAEAIHQPARQLLAARWLQSFFRITS